MHSSKIQRVFTISEGIYYICKRIPNVIRYLFRNTFYGYLEIGLHVFYER